MAKSTHSSSKVKSTLSAVGFSKPNAVDLTTYTPAGIRRAALADLLLRGLAVGDEAPVDGVISGVAVEMGYLSALVGESDPELGTLLYRWAQRLRVGAELARRIRTAKRRRPGLRAA